jgi:glucose-6-phosphate isomerase
MKHLKIQRSPVELDLKNFSLKGEPVICQQRVLNDIASIFLDQEAVKLIPPETSVYHVQSWLPVDEGTPGGLSFGTSTLLPGKVGNEYFMTKGHFHAKSDRAEFYWGVQGNGMLILMDRDRKIWAEEVYPGSLHYIGDEIAHRLANTGSANLVVGACWPSDAGHDYQEIATNGFSARLLEMDGNPVLADCEK